MRSGRGNSPDSDDEETVSVIASSAATTARAEREPTGFGLQLSPSKGRPAAVLTWDTFTAGASSAIEQRRRARPTPAKRIAVDETEEDGAAGGAEADADDGFGSLADVSMHRINALESALGDANRELRARAQAEEHLLARVEELSRTIEEQRSALAAKDAEIVRLTAQAHFVAETPKRSRARRGGQRDSVVAGTMDERAHGGPSVSPSSSSVPVLPPLTGGIRSHSSLL